jgi:hypothetical protein
MNATVIEELMFGYLLSKRWHLHHPSLFAVRTLQFR